MNEAIETVKVQAAAISDRGLSDKRPLNEDSFLSDPARGIFAVADGVGGTQAGEVASQTAIEVLDEAFRHQLTASDDVEDLMELAIQRANTSIYQMAREHPKLATMATTIVALHLSGKRATLGHVGDSRIYRVSPQGQIFRETDDHSIVEEEVRAGRMTPEQAATHPSRNVISRALGAEATVEVDLKELEVEDGTTFLLCSDGITRHIPDHELQSIITASSDLNAICAEFKRRCYERGAEDNLTAVLIRVGGSAGASAPVGLSPLLDEDEEPTVSLARPAIAAPEPVVTAPAFEAATQPPLPAAPRRSIVGRIARGLLFFAFTGVVGAAAFYGGLLFEQKRQSKSPGATALPVSLPSPVATTTPSAEARYEKMRREVDRAPGMMVQQLAPQVSASTDPEIHYLYGRALLLSGQPREALDAFKRTIALLDERGISERDALKVETRITTAAAALLSNDFAPVESADRELDKIIEKEVRISGGGPAPSASP
jgi:protein phosphatase